MRKGVVVLAAGLTAVTALADEQVINLKKAPGVEKVEGNCAACHSLAYIPMNSPYLTAAQWEAEVNKMISVMGAPIDDAKAIKEYFGKEL